ncbi:hypothetical protein ACRVGM_002016 [Cronobacter sakazakii]
MSTISNDVLEKLSVRYRLLAKIHDGSESQAWEESALIVEELLALRKDRERAEHPQSELSQRAQQILRDATALAATLSAETDTTGQQFESLAGKAVVPEGWKLVPLEPTVEMQIAFAETWFSKVRCVDDCELEDAYIAMLAAAPEPCK